MPNGAQFLRHAISQLRGAGVIIREQGRQFLHIPSQECAVHHDVNLALGQVVSLALPGRNSPTRATLGETRNTAGSAVWQGSLIDGDEVESMTLVKGALETHITVATLDGSLSIIIDNATGKTVITDENQLVMRADPNDSLHYDHKELAPLPPPTQG